MGMRHLTLLALLAGCGPSPADVAACQTIEPTMRGVASCLVTRGWTAARAADTAWTLYWRAGRPVHDEVACLSTVSPGTHAPMRECLVQSYGWLPAPADSTARRWSETARR